MSKDTVKDNFEIVIQPGEDNVPYTFTAAPCSSATANNGNIPYGTNVQSVAVTAHKDDGDNTDATADLIASTTVVANVITVKLQYPSTNGVGKYHLKFLLTLDTGSIVIHEDYKRVRAIDL